MNSFFIGFVGGAMISVILVCVACIQMWPRWKAWGFVRATNDEERLKILSYQQETKRNTYKYLWIGVLIYPVYEILIWFINEDNLGGAAIGFTVFFLPLYILTCFILDYLTRNHIIKF